MVDLDVSTSRLEQVQHSITKQLVTWDKTNSEDIIKYKNNTSANLSKVHLNHELIMCNNVSCKDHHAAIQQLYNDITGAIKESSDFLMTNSKASFQPIPGWNKVAKDAHYSAHECFLLWHANDSPRYGPLYQQMRISRAHCKRTLCQCKADKTRNQADSLAKHLLSKDSK